MNKFIRTYSGAQVLPPAIAKERGQKSWRYASFSARTFFLIEACVDQRRDIEVINFVTTDVSEAYRIEREISECRWSRVQMFMRFRDVTKQELTYEELSAAYRSRSNGSHWYHLASGHLIAETGVSTRELINLESEFELVYERRGGRSELHSFF